jgi:hypothetical protein
LKFIFCLCALFLVALACSAQDSLQEALMVPADTTELIEGAPADTVPAAQPGGYVIFPDHPYKKRVKAVAAFNVGVYGGLLLVLNNTWYNGYPRSRLKSFDDSREWLQADKVGHVFSAYFEGKYSMELWRWAGLPRKQRIWIGGLSGAVYQTAIEFLDGTSEKWGWSWSDFAANCIGSGMVIGQELAWDEQRLQLKMGYTREKYDPTVLTRVHELFGKSGFERFLKDYNGQTYWLSANLRSFFKESKIPRWLNVSVGYGATGMLGGFENTWTTKEGIKISRPDIKRQRQWYLAPDIDLTRIKTNKKLLKMALYFLNMIKIPAPALELTGGKVKLRAVMF